MNTNTENQLETLYHLRDKFVIIALTGRLGSGCTSAANFLTYDSFDKINFPRPISGNAISNEDRKYKIAYNFLKENWKQFTLIRASDVITAIVLLHEIEEFKKFLKTTYGDSEEKKNTIDVIIQNISPLFESLKKKLNEVIDKDIDPSKTYKYNFIEKEKRETLELFGYTSNEAGDCISGFSNLLKKEFEQLKSPIKASPFQYFGDNIRKTGNPFSDEDSQFDPRNSYIISEIINQLIKICRTVNDKRAHIVIDSLRNSMEARYFKERFSAFYLFAINTENQFRETRLANLYNQKELRSLDNEYNRNLKPEETFYRQDIKNCIQVSDVYLYNPNDESKIGDSYTTLKKSLIRYIALILQPGIITPTPQERCMQIAYTAKYNSGCISRQVGAVVTDNTYSIKSIGWNNTPEGQTPCLLRNVDDLKHNTDAQAFSEYEKNGEIRALIEMNFNSIDRSKLRGRNLSFCFKEAQNCLEQEKNQVHTRSLHAEENAMLQISKYGGEGLKDGFLFTTASPCELCSKKAYQLGITKVFYIDPYPGIAKEQILISGVEKHQPKLELFVGAIGRAYHNLFEPFLSYKDELKILLKYDYPKTQVAIIKAKPTNEKAIYTDRLTKTIESQTEILENIDEESINLILNQLAKKYPEKFREIREKIEEPPTVDEPKINTEES